MLDAGTTSSELVTSMPGQWVLLMELPAVYGHGLHSALTSAAIGEILLVDRHGLRSALAGTRTPVVVVPGPRAELLPSLSENSSENGRFEVVQILEDVNPTSFTSALRAGATGVLDAETDLETAVEVIRAAAAGRTLLSAPMRRALSRATVRSVSPALDPRELSWLRLLGQGATVASLAQSAAYSEREMYRLLSKVYDRLGASTRTQALLRAERWGLLDD